MLKVNAVQKVFETRSGPLHAIDNISFQVERGEFVSIVGPSGCGKSTLLRVIGDIIEPTAGTVSVNGHPSREAREHGAVSVVFQNPALLPWRRAIDNVRLPLEILRRSPSRTPEALLEMVGLSGYEGLYPHELSGGMQQRVALARALTHDPIILLMDEPFSATDELTRAALNDQLLRIWGDTGVTIVFVTHALEEAVFLSDRVLALSARPGRLTSILPVPFPRPRIAQLKERPEFHEFVRRLSTCLG